MEILCELREITQLGKVESVWEPVVRLWGPTLNTTLHCVVVSFLSYPVPGSWESRQWEASKDHWLLHLRLCVLF